MDYVNIDFFFYCELSFINHDNAVLVIINKGEVKKIRYNFEFLFVISIFHRSLHHFMIRSLTGWLNLVVGPIETIIIWFQYNLFPSLSLSLSPRKIRD